ncbi:sensor domain-containing diguanylate cyclase [Marinobacter litoralis]|uniref:sensor domain-containing diguanylate cyclase n=1 Tax=Marinobacter litoralis TaxID=187981 RepID=UPI0018EB9F0E|nr:sensor domain-containing diguanylate cyclase [Marinobacter litoralis]MBJ6138844.1 GGDEF domain-containing protein [Marinobacter litoralis]
MTAINNNTPLTTTSGNLLPFIESLPDAVVIVDQNHKIVLVNALAGSMFGYAVDELKGSDLSTIIPMPLRNAHRKHVNGYFKKPVLRPMGEEKRFSGVRSNGQEVPVDIMINTIVLDGAKVAMALVRDVTYQRELEARLTLESLTDEMTGFYNRKHFKTQLNAQLSGYVRWGLPTSVIMFDLDHFKKINDQYGHAAGDLVLTTTAKLVRGELRPLDVGCRIGGEEFAIVLPNTNLEDAETLAERIRLMIEETEFELDQVSFKATATMGVATFLPTDDSYDLLMKRADNVLYMGKAAGRNCTLSQNALLTTDSAG